MLLVVNNVVTCRLLELNHKDITSRVQKELGKMKKSLSKMSIKGAQILANKL